MAYRDEIARLEAMHAANPEGRVFAHLAEAYRKGGELERARDVLIAGLERHPAYASAHVVLGRVLLDLQDREAADGAFRRVLELDPHNMVALRARADIAHETGHAHEALGLYRELISIDPSDEHVSLRILEIESKPASIEPPAAPMEAPAAPIAAPAAPMEAPAAPVDEPAALADERAPAEDTVPEYGEASLPAIGEEAALEEPMQSVDGLDLGPAVESESVESSDGKDVDLGIGRLLEPTDMGGPAAAEAGAGAIQPDAVLDLGGMDGEFSVPEPEPEPIADITDPYDLPGVDEIAAAATPVELPLPTAPADEPAPAPGSAAQGPPAPADEPGDIASLFSTHDDGDAEALPNIGPELVTETIADLYAQQGLYERAANVYRRLLEQRPGDAGIESKLESARAAMNAAEVAIGTFAARTVAERKGAVPVQPEPAASEPEEESAPLPMLADLAEDEEEAEPLPMLEDEPASDRVADAEPVDEPEPAGHAEPVVEPESPGRAAPAYAEWNSPETTTHDTARIFDLPPLDAEPEAAMFDLPPLEPEGDDASLDLPPLDAEPAGAFDLPLLDDDTAAEPPFVPAQDLGLEPIGAGQGDSLAPPPAPQEPEELEGVESAWTGGAGAAAPTDSPFGWAEPEAAPEQSTIGEYLESLLTWRPAPPAASEPPAPVPPAAAMPPIEPEPWLVPDPVPEPEPARKPESAEPSPKPEPAAPASAPPAASAPVADLGVDDIDALFSAQPPVAHEEISALFEKPASAASDDIDALFGDLQPAPEPAPPPPAPAAQQPTAQQRSAPPPAAAPAPPPPTGAEGDSAEGAAFDWDPFAELPVTAPAAPAPAPPEPEPAPGDTHASGSDDDEDIDMFRAWLQSLKR